MERLIRLGLLVAVVSGARVGVASAQDITQWTLRVYTAGATNPLTAPFVLLRAAVTCNQPPPLVAPAVNPTQIIFDDPVVTGMVCTWRDTGKGPLFAVPVGTGKYEGTLTATNSVGTSVESNRAPFTRPGQAPGAPTGVRVVD